MAAMHADTVFRDYLKEMKKVGKEGGQLEILALATEYQVRAPHPPRVREPAAHASKTSRCPSSTG